MQEFITEFWFQFSKPDNFVGHIAYVLLIISMLMRNINWLRFFAVLAGSISAIYYFTLGDFVSMFWESIFTLVNLGQFVLLKMESRRGGLSSEQLNFIATCVPDIERAHSRRLARLGSIIEVPENEILMTEETVPQFLKFVLEGSARVERAGKQVGKVEKGDFLGEMSFLTGNPASATVITTTPMRYLAFQQNILKAHLERHPETRYALEASFNQNLVTKLVKTGSPE